MVLGDRKVRYDELVRAAVGVSRRLADGGVGPGDVVVLLGRHSIEAVVAMLGPGLGQVMIAVGVVNIPIFARLLRGSILAQRENDFVLAARAVGVKRRNILVSHILPNAMSVVIVQGTLAMATAIIDVAGLGFLGLGPQNPATPEWGTMLTDVNDYLSSAAFLAIIPGIAIVLSVLGFNLIGDGLREALDPKLRGR